MNHWFAVDDLDLKLRSYKNSRFRKETAVFMAAATGLQHSQVLPGIQDLHRVNKEEAAGGPVLRSGFAHSTNLTQKDTDFAQGLLLCLRSAKIMI